MKIKFKKGMNLLEIVMAIIFLGTISEIILGIGELNKTNANTNININTHLLLDSEIEQAKGNCYVLNTATCSARGGSSNGNDLLLVGNTCTFNYTINGFDGKSNSITTTCAKLADNFFNITVSLTKNNITFKGEGFVTND